MKTSAKTWPGAGALALMLVACGGGGDGSGTSAASTTAAPQSVIQGAYSGRVSNGREHNTLILDDNRYYTLYGNTVNGLFAVTGFIQGTGTANNGSFSSSDLRDYYSNGTVVAGSMSASYTPNVSFNGTLSAGGQSVTFTGTPTSTTLFNYNTPATLSDITGAWTVYDLSGTRINLSIQSSGAFTGSSSGCSITGTISPRAAGKNVFDVSLMFGGSPCLYPNQSASGIAIEYKVGTARQLVMAGTTTSRSVGTAFIGTR
jgi:hypothetical protein